MLCAVICGRFLVVAQQLHAQQLLEGKAAVSFGARHGPDAIRLSDAEAAAAGCAEACYAIDKDHFWGRAFRYRVGPLKGHVPPIAIEAESNSKYLMDVRQLSRWVPYGPGGFIFACRVGRRGVYKAVTGGDKFDDYLELGRYRGYLKGPPRSQPRVVKCGRSAGDGSQGHVDIQGSERLPVTGEVRRDDVGEGPGSRGHPAFAGRGGPFAV